MPSLSAEERETHISFDDANDTALVTTHMRTMVTKLRNNGAAEEVGTDPFGGVTFRIPKKLVSFRNVRKASTRAPMSAEARKAAAARLAKARSERSGQ